MMTQLKLDSMRGKIPQVEPTNGCWLAGGAIRSWFTGAEDISDIDVFSPSESASKEMIVTLGDRIKLVDEHKNATTYLCNGQRVQFIKLYHPTPEACLESFDYNVCQFIWTDQGIFATPEAIIGTLRGHLSVAKISKDFAVDSLRRAFKYQKKGFEPCAGTIRDIANSLRQLTEEEVRAQVEMSPKGGSRVIRFD